MTYVSVCVCVFFFGGVKELEASLVITYFPLFNNQASVSYNK